MRNITTGNETIAEAKMADWEDETIAEDDG